VSDLDLIIHSVNEGWDLEHRDAVVLVEALAALRSPPADEALDALVQRAERWAPGLPDAPRATVRDLVATVQRLRVALAEQGEHVESARAIARARREADTAELETLRARAERCTCEVDQ